MAELKAHKIGDLAFDFKMGKNIAPEYYTKSDVYSALSAKDKEIEGWKAGYNNLLNVDIPRIESNLKKEIAELKATLESEKASRYAESVDAGMRERRLKRALWLARAERAHLKVLEYWPDYCHNAHCRIALLKWEEVERKCRAKAEEYK